MFHLITTAIHQYLENISSDDIKAILDQVNDSDSWNAFIHEIRTYVEDALFRKEFAQNCQTMSSATLIDLKDHPTFGTITTEELEARAERRKEREELLASLHPDNGQIIAQFVLSDWRPPLTLEADISEEEIAEVNQTNHTVYTWALDTFFSEAFKQKKDYDKISYTSDRLPCIIDYLVKHNESGLITAVCDTVIDYWRNMPITPDIGIAWYLSMAQNMMCLAREYPTHFPSPAQNIDISKKHLIALQSYEFTPISYALSLLRTLGRFDGCDDIIEEITYDYIASHPDPSELLIVYLNGWFSENAKADLLPIITNPKLKALIMNVCAD
jgi:hypothetical protein